MSVAAQSAADRGLGSPSGRAEEPRASDVSTGWDVRRPHRLWPRMLVIVLTLAGLVLTVEFLQGLSQIVAPVFLGLNFIIVAYPVQAWLTYKGLHPVLGATVTVLLVGGVLTAFVGLMLWSVLELVDALPEYTHEFQDIAMGLTNYLISLGITPEAMTQQVEGTDWKSVTGTAVTALTAIATNTWAVMGLLLTVIMGMFFLAMDSMGIERRVALLNTARSELGEALISFARGVRRYWLVTTVFGLIVAVLDVVALMIIGVPLVLVWGVLSFLTNYIPNIGFVIGLIPPALLALVEGGWPAFIAVVASYSVLNFVLQSVIQPKVAGDAIGVIPTVSFLSLLFWAWVFGPLGAILALPATLLVKAVLIDADPHARWMNAFISADLRGMERRHLMPLRRREAQGVAAAGHTEEPASGRDAVGQGTGAVSEGAGQDEAGAVSEGAGRGTGSNAEQTEPGRSSVGEAPGEASGEASPSRARR